jgi:hypothetical protein
VPIGIGIRGDVTFSSDLLRPTVVDSDAQFFSKERMFLSMGAGSATLAYRPIPFEGRFTVSQIRLMLGTSGNPLPALGGKEVAPLSVIPETCTDLLNTLPEGCEPRRDDFLPEVDVFDLTTGAWARLPRLMADAGYTLADPTRYVDPASGQMLVRFINDSPESSVGFGFQVALEGEVQ